MMLSSNVSSRGEVFFRNICPGMALSLEEESAGVWLNCGASSLHKFVISFSVGVELVSSKVRVVL